VNEHSDLRGGHRERSRDGIPGADHVDAAVANRHLNGQVAAARGEAVAGNAVDGADHHPPPC
jgi:hypothetical protein